jgi:Flp pilus assembly CpaE family ATPase
MPALKDARLLFNELTGAEFPAENVLLVLNEVDRSGRITRDQISNFLKHEVAVEIPDDPTAIEAVNNGRPLIAMDSKRSIAVRPLMNLVQLIRDSVGDSKKPGEQLVEEQRRGGILGNILGG